MTYEKMNKPSETGKYYDELIEGYNYYKACEGTIVVAEGTDEECLFVEQKHTGYFPITSLHRDDFENIGYDASGLDDGKMTICANKLADFFLEYGGYWDYLREFADEFNLPKSKEND
jgi:hypothetical protein